MFLSFSLRVSDGHDVHLPVGTSACVSWKQENKNILFRNPGKSHTDTRVSANLGTFLFRWLEFLTPPRPHGHTCVSWEPPEADPRWGWSTECVGGDPRKCRPWGQGAVADTQSSWWKEWLSKLPLGQVEHRPWATVRGGEKCAPLSYSHPRGEGESNVSI